jgi:hypothetical protein
MPGLGGPPDKISKSPFVIDKELAISSLHNRSDGLGEGVGRTLDQHAPSTWRAGPPTTESPGVSSMKREYQVKEDRLDIYLAHRELFSR